MLGEVAVLKVQKVWKPGGRMVAVVVEGEGEDEEGVLSTPKYPRNRIMSVVKTSLVYTAEKNAVPIHCSEEQV